MSLLVLEKKAILYGYSERKHKMMWAYPEDREFYVAGIRFVVPAHYEFDGATVPRPFWFVFSPVGVTFEAASLHDLLYDTKGMGFPGCSTHNLNRRDVDEIFYRHMLQDNAPLAQAKIMWVGVQVGAKGYWNEDSFPDYLLK